MAKRYSKRTTYKKRSLRKSRSNRRRTQRAGFLGRVSQIRNAASGVNWGPMSRFKPGPVRSTRSPPSSSRPPPSTPQFSVTGTKAQLHERPSAAGSLFSSGMDFFNNHKGKIAAAAATGVGLYAANKVKNHVKSKIQNPFLSAGLGGINM